MDHARPDLQIRRHIDGPKPAGDPHCIVEQCLGRTNLDQDRRESRKIGMERRNERLASAGPTKIGAGELFR